MCSLSCDDDDDDADDDDDLELEAQEDKSIDKRVGGPEGVEVDCGRDAGSDCRVGLELGADFGVNVDCVEGRLTSARSLWLSIDL